MGSFFRSLIQPFSTDFMQPNRKLAIVGYGKMGRLVAQLAPEYSFEVALTLRSSDNRNGRAITGELFRDIDVAVEFSNPEAAVDNLVRLSELGVPTVTGTTGWIEHLSAVRDAIERTRSALVWSPNFSVGVAVFRKVVERASELLKAETEYGAWAWEVHHDAKKDAPSGTLLSLVQAMKTAGYERGIDTASNRAGKHPGTHEIGFDSAADTITLRHAARSREGFARGALKAARWIIGRSGVYTFDDVLFGPDGEG
jgi:4-hydroxy-tetrahydrodipicolinate reductase